MKTKGCEECGKPIKWWSKRFCSYACYGKWKSRNVEGTNNPNYKGGDVKLICKQCNKEFFIPHTQRNRAKFCSKTCQEDFYESRNINKTCEYCGKIYRTIISKDRRSRFCSEKCRNEWNWEHNSGENHMNWSGGKVGYRGQNWNKQRKMIRKRDKYTCQNCGITEKELKKELDVHHIIPFREFGLKNYKMANDPKNLVCLCVRCHLKIERSNYSYQLPLKIT